MLESEPDFKMQAQFGVSSPLKIGGPELPIFGRFPTRLQLNGKYLLQRARHDIDYGRTAWETAKRSLHQNSIKFGPQTAQNGTFVLPTVRKCRMFLFWQLSQTEVKERESTKLCQMPT